MRKERISQKIIAGLLLFAMTFSGFANVTVDPNSQYNTGIDRAQNGVPVINISTPNNRGISINEFLEYNVGREGQILNNADNLGRSHLGGIIGANPNLGADRAANLILLQVNGSNRSQIEGYIEALSRQRVDVIVSNENGIYLNGAGTINIRNFVPTTGRVRLKDGDIVGIDVEKGRVAVGSGGFDATDTDYVNVISKALELQGNLVGNRIDATLGENTVDGSGKVTPGNGTGSVAIDGSHLGSMYAGQIKIVSTDRGAGVNSRGIIYSRDGRLEITADGKISVAKIRGSGIEVGGREFEQTELSSSDKDISITAGTIKLDGETQATGGIVLNGNVENRGDILTGTSTDIGGKLENHGNLSSAGRIKVGGSILNTGSITLNGYLNAGNVANTGEISALGKISVGGLTSGGTLKTNESIDINGTFTNDGTLQSVKEITVSGRLKNTETIATNGNLTAGDTDTEGTMAVRNLTVGNLRNDGKITTDGNLTAKNTTNTGEILSLGKVSTDSLTSSGALKTDDELNINGKLDNKGSIEAVKNVSASGGIKNSGLIATNGNFTGRNTENRGKIYSGTFTVDNLTNDGTVESSGELGSGDVRNSGNILAQGKISTKDIDNTGKILTNERIEAGNIKNSDRIASGKGITAKRVDNSGTLATNGSLKVSDSLANSGDIEGRKIDVTGRELTNSGKISADSIRAKVSDTRNDGHVFSGSDIDLDTKTLTNTKEMLAVDNVNTDGSQVLNTGRIASNGKVSLDSSGITNTGGDSV